MCAFYGAWKLQGSLKAGNDECLEDLGSGKLNVPYSTVSGGFWEVWRLEMANVSRIWALGDSD